MDTPSPNNSVFASPLGEAAYSHVITAVNPSWTVQSLRAVYFLVFGEVELREAELRIVVMDLIALRFTVFWDLTSCQLS